DLDYGNPEVFCAMADVMLGLARTGVDVLRLDAVPFLWKRKGTDCQNQPEVHDLLHAFRAVMRIAAPAVAFKAEAIVSPRELVTYLGVGRHESRECDIAYHNVLMVLLWSSLASGRAGLMTHVLETMPPTPPSATWLTYVRGHDDIGWAITDEDAGAVGEDGYAHRRFLIDFYAGDFPGSFARGARFQEDPRTGDARTSGTTASLAGLEAALDSGDQITLELAIRRILLLHAIAFAHGGLPVIYMGDELGLLNDAAWDADPAHRDDNRWMHRPPMDWPIADARHDRESVPGQIFAGLCRLVTARRATRAVHADGTLRPLRTGNDHVFAMLREHAGERVLLLANLTAGLQPVGSGVMREHGLALTPSAAEADGRMARAQADSVLLEPYQFLWLRAEA
ncbi:MAG: GH13_4 / GH13_16, partial [uncultured Solirubrobacteraceae bacterium]